MIGTSQYSDDRLPPLHAVTATVDALRAALTDPDYGILPPENCTVLADEGDLRQVGIALRTAARQAEDLLLIFYSGHGLTSGLRHDLYLALRDSDFAEPEFNALEYDKLRGAVLDSPAKTKVIILDCCFAGRAVSQTMAAADAAFTQQTEVGGTYVLTAAPRDKVALVLDGEEHTAFTGRLLRLLTDGVPEASELLSIDDLYRHLYRTMQAEGLPIPQKHGTLNADELALTRNRAFAATAAPELQARRSEIRKRAFEGEWSASIAELRDIHTRQARILGAEHQDTLLTLQLIGRCESASGNPEQGIVTLSELLRVESATLGSEHPQTLTTRQILAVATGESGARGEAVDMLRILLPVRRRVLGPDDDHACRTAHMLARNLIAIGELAEAEAILCEVVAVRERILGTEHPHTVRTRRDLDSLVAAGVSDHERG
nr:tetratricopeptide repeat protein [Nocardia bovistercoris]